MKLYSWGSNSHGQLGQGTEAEEVLSPVPVDISVEPKYITGGGKHTILVTSCLEVYTTGDNDKGQLGIDQAKKLVNIFQHLNIKLNISKVTCGWDFNLVLTENGEVFAWGSNSFGQLGLSVKKIKYLSSPQKIFEKKAVDIGAGLRHSGIVTSDGFVYTSGYGRKGQLGVFLSKTLSAVDNYTLVENLNNCREISCGECHCIAKTADEEFYSWGNNKYGQLGLDSETISFSATPLTVAVPQISGISHIFSGWAHNFILTENGQIIAWGRNDFGQLGECRELSWKPKFLRSVKNIKQVGLGSHHSVVLTESGEIFTWGWNEHGNCGNGSFNNILEPYKLGQFSEVKLIGSGAAQSFLWC